MSLFHTHPPPSWHYSVKVGSGVLKGEEKLLSSGDIEEGAKEWNGLSMVQPMSFSRIYTSPQR